MGAYNNGVLMSDWFVVDNDVIGGWAITTERTRFLSDAQAAGALFVAEFITEDVAQHVCDVHNEWLNGDRG